MEPYYLLNEAAALSKGAKACGYTGLVLLEGILHPERYENVSSGATRPEEGAAGRGRRRGGQWAGKVLANEHPTYYGMMAALFERKQ